MTAVHERVEVRTVGAWRGGPQVFSPARHASRHQQEKCYVRCHVGDTGYTDRPARKLGGVPELRGLQAPLLGTEVLRLGERGRVVVVKP